MREIEFRGWDAENKCWRYGYYQKRQESTLAAFGNTQEDIDNNTKHYIIWDGFSDWNMTKPLYRADVVPESVGQWSGLYDKNKKRIYEGDKVLVDMHYDGDAKIFGRKDLVVFDSGCFDLESYIGYDLSMCALNNMVEVIDNTYDDNL